MERNKHGEGTIAVVFNVTFVYETNGRTVHTDVLLTSPKARSKAVNKRSEIGDTGSEAQTKASEKWHYEVKATYVTFSIWS
ncbi:hypothetical protein F2Q69_00054288 [Brassica cretica]|uniref:Uncharacterized protein n=1 Tax=Brassica cretica TaxID=69181 RepID=A0A8S9NBQ3_BRACR|nr:hypothetical protein F2Q69_00054288 [Brassica cretica]